ncbi:endoplasmic reticulum-based factor for assembly of V-ATPase-domain-containing protein [Bombardia bombarda]|uniref:Endoplasmic reticulum-based factor for assembly of V-ATPase-domain-containing protein n=1 Tax=Bombardia bombarda TaxID=252184 RepID=A0AA39X0W8_9PEZI|nr:endoplasmic reticulum-based factor for assembly of V-ATPase-domain-containing protein [Bombardia bombarda]
MVLLTMTPSVVEGFAKLEELRGTANAEPESQPQEGESSLDGAAVGNPISHGQVVALWTKLASHDCREYSLEKLLKGSRVYVPPPPPKPEPSDEYRALMARLRRGEEQRAYERMMNPGPPMETFSQRYPSGAAMAHAFAEANRPSREEDLGDDDVTYNDVHRQLTLILNIVVSILGVAATLWILARWWSTPARLFLTMGGSLLVGIAEVVVYSGYIWHLGEAKKKDKTFKEVKEVLQTWVVGTEDNAGAQEPVAVDGKVPADDENLRRRKKVLEHVDIL